MAQVVVSLKQREWQKPLIKAYRDGIRHGVVIAHRRAGKDRASMFIELELENKYRGIEIWHALPEQEQARKVVWDVRTRDGERLIDVAFPPAIRRKTSETEMKIEFGTGGLWRLVGADRINALMGGNPRHVTFSEFAVTNPIARQLIRPILAENKGSELIITTPRGYNHAFDLFKYAQTSALWYAAIHPVGETGLIPQEELDEERRTMPDELYRQEYDCDFSAANIGAILGKYIEELERKGWIDCDDALYDPAGAPVEVSSDIGYRDAAAFWFWQPRRDGYALVDYMSDNGMDADDWIDRLKTVPYNVGTYWLPHDARVKTFQSKRSTVEAFLQAKISTQVKVVPQAKVGDRINAARVVARRCRFSPQAAEGVKALRAWSFKYDAERKAFSAEPEHDWASHGGDGFSYGAQVMQQYQPKATPAPTPVTREASYAFTLDDLAEDPRTNPHFGRQ